MPGTPRGVRKASARENWAMRKRAHGKGMEYAFTSFPESTQAALLLREQPSTPRARRTPQPSEAQITSAWQRFESAKQTQKDVAEQRLRAVQALDALVRSGTPVMEARKAVSDQLTHDGMKGCSPVNLARWQKAVAHTERHHWLALLLPHYTGRTATAEIPGDAWDLFKADWLRVEKPSAVSCYERLERIAQARGWELPSLRTFERRLQRELPRAIRVLAREGEEAMMKMYPAQERDRSVFAALEAVNSDGHKFDLMVRFPDGHVGRPMIVAFQDLYSGKILGWRLSDHESSDVVRLALADMVIRYGVPQHTYLDNGRAFASKWMTGGTRNRYRFKVREEDPVGIITSLGIEVHWVTPYHGQAKPIERAWRDLCCEHIAKHPAFAGAYTGNNPMAKPENYGSRAIEWEAFERIVTEEIAAHNARSGRRSKVCAGRSFDAVFAESYACATIRKVTQEQQRMLFMAAEAVTAGNDGSVRLAGNRYWTEALTEVANRKVVLRVDPQHLQGTAYVYALDGTFIAEAPCVAAVGFADTNAAREHGRARKDWRRARKQQLDAERRMDAAEIAAQLPTPPPEQLPDAAVIAPVFRDHGKRPVPAPREDIEWEATGTDGLSSLDRFMAQASERLNDDVI